MCPETQNANRDKIYIVKAISIISGKVVSNITKNLKLGSGSTWPGHVALKADPRFIGKFVRKNPHLKIVLIAGTNGKTTTTKALQHILESNGIEAITNNSGANLVNGLASSLLHNSNIFGKTKKETLIFEVDENSLPLVLREIPSPDALVFLNLFRDQLDRYGEVNTVAEKWKDEISKLSEKTLVVANADDPQIAFLGTLAKNAVFYSIPDKFKTENDLSHAVDSITCPKCNSPLNFINIAYSHIGNYRCTNCDFKNPASESMELFPKLKGNYNLYNLSSAAIAATNIFNVSREKVLASIRTFTPAFGRQEVISVKGKKIMLLLSKNPTGFNESLKVAAENNSDTVFLLLNDRIPDGRDISWIWDIDFENLKNTGKIFISGDRAYDMANRLYYAGIKSEVFENFRTGYKKAMLATENGRILTILPTYSAMLEIRKIISGRKIL